MRRVAALAVVVFGIVAAACAGTTPISLDISTKTGYAVVVEQTAEALSIGFSDNRDAAAGQPYEVTDAIWRVGDGPWLEPPVTCLGKGQRVQLGIAQVENASRPGLLEERVVWLVCLPPEG
jgi:hypothetical protein